MYESRAERPLSGVQFALRMIWHAVGVVALIAGSLLVGMAGYIGFEHLHAIDAFLNAAMLLGGMGPIHNPQTWGGKLFAGVYALYCGLVVIATMSVLIAPVLHRAVHLFHWRKDTAK